MKNWTMAAAVIFLSIVQIGCNRLACNRMAECLEEEQGADYSDEDIDECVDDLMEEDFGCRRATRALGRCLKWKDCEFEKCVEEAEDLLEACNLDDSRNRSYFTDPESNGECCKNEHDENVDMLRSIILQKGLLRE